MVEKSAESSGIVMIADLDDLDGVFPPEQEITIYRIIQESVNNVIKHARAREARIAVRSYEDHVEITVRDDGQGFAPVKAPTSAPNAGAALGGFGLKGLAERVEMLGGTHTIESAPGTTVGHGTTVTVRIGTGPIDASARRGHRAWRATSAS
jgi:signal transduction histidine kinase